METHVFEDKGEMGAAAAAAIAGALRDAIGKRGGACMVMATGASQFETIDALTREDVDWTRVTCFHMDEYIGLQASHPASFRRYLKERFVDRVKGMRAFHYVDGSAADPQAECDRLGALIERADIDIVQGGIGENGHLAFNDPPADFETNRSYLVVDLDEACRRQQFGEGWFQSMEDVPKRAISISIPRLMTARRIVCTVPDKRKARAVKDCLEGPVTNEHPASILQHHADCRMFLDTASGDERNHPNCRFRRDKIP
jgi:glucosamine-6-phosphate deaminase